MSFRKVWRLYSHRQEHRRAADQQAKSAHVHQNLLSAKDHVLALGSRTQDGLLVHALRSRRLPLSPISKAFPAADHLHEHNIDSCSNNLVLHDQ